jgi:predicted dithiol-disulfide oxidoreductase (DUF899 family)
MQNGLRCGLRSCSLKQNTKQPPSLLLRNAKPFRGEAGPENLPGVSIFKRDADGQVYHTYSVFGSALLELVQDNFMFDLTPEGRPEGAPEMSFLKHKDAYRFPGGIYQL